MHVNPGPENGNGQPVQRPTEAQPPSIAVVEPAPIPERQAPFFGWAGWDLLSHALLLGAAQTLWWLVIFGGSNWLTSLHDRRVRIHLDAELHIPFIPVMVFVYFSITPLFTIAPFILRTRRELHALTAALAVVIPVAGIGFLLVPAESAYPSASEPGEAGWLSLLLAFAKRMTLQYNMMPSLHVALSTVCVAAYATRAELLGKVLLWTWAGVIAASTLLIHFHHLIDVASGFALAGVAKRFIYDRWLQPSCRLSASDEHHP